MRKLIIFLIPVFLFIHGAYATDSCEQIVLQDAEFVGEITVSANVRDYPCVNKSKVIRGSKVGERFNVVAKVDGWYKVKLDSGEIVWIRDQAMKKVGELPEELKEKKVVEEVRVIKLEAKPAVKVTESTEYVLTTEDYVLINRVNARIKSIIDDKWEEYKDVFISRLEKLLSSKSRSKRFIKVVEQIIEDIGNMK